MEHPSRINHHHHHHHHHRSSEGVDYASAAASFQAARRSDPYRVEGLELYSTVLWHLRKEAELAHLAQEAMAIDRLAPQTWWVGVGGGFLECGRWGWSDEGLGVKGWCLLHPY